MTFFAVLGFVTYVLFCFELGQTIGRLHDFSRGVQSLVEPVDTTMREIEALIGVLTYGKSARNG